LLAVFAQFSWEFAAFSSSLIFHGTNTAISKVLCAQSLSGSCSSIDNAKPGSSTKSLSLFFGDEIYAPHWPKL
jgi:hypothetical protein